MECHTAGDKADFLKRMAEAEAKNIKHQANSKPEQRVSNYSWNETSTIQQIAEKLERIATGNQTQINQDMLIQLTAENYCSLITPSEGEYLVPGARWSEKIYRTSTTKL